MTETRRGFSGDDLILVLFAFVMGITIIVGAVVLDSLKNTNNAIFNQYTAIAFNSMLSFNFVPVLFVVGSGMALIASAFLVKTHPTFFVMFMLIQLVGAYVSLQFANVWQGIFTGNTLSSVANQFNIWAVLMQYFPFISIILGIIFAVATFAKGGDSGG